ncbi:hypothetical protein ABTL52_19745, partial [Acinetobacter baumannii]
GGVGGVDVAVSGAAGAAEGAGAGVAGGTAVAAVFAGGDWTGTGPIGSLIQTAAATTSAKATKTATRVFVIHGLRSVSGVNLV